MLADLMIDENGILNNNIFTEIKGDEKSTIINEVRNTIIKLLIYSNFIRELAGFRQINNALKEVEIEKYINKKIKETYWEDFNKLQNLSVDVFILNNVIWVFFTYEHSDGEIVPVFNHKIIL